MTIWLVLTLVTGLTVVEPTTGPAECFMRGGEAVQSKRALKFSCAIGNRQKEKAEI
jgi:hypothetical protein